MPCFVGSYRSPINRRQSIIQLGAAGLTVAGILSRPAVAGASLFPKGSLTKSVTELYGAAGGTALGELAAFRISGSDLPWDQELMTVTAGQPVTFLLGGRWYISREADSSYRS